MKNNYNLDIYFFKNKFFLKINFFQQIKSFANFLLKNKN
jgi:hypothetical protein